MGEDWMMGIWGMIFTIIAVVGFLIVILFVFTGKSVTGHDDKLGKETPLGILKRRYATGDITKKEFEEKKEDIV